MNVEIVQEAHDELKNLPPEELRAMVNALEKLQVVGDRLPYPHSSRIQGTQMRELRPRAGRSPWRAIYQRVGNRLVIVAIAPEAQHDSRGFKRAVQQALTRLEQIKGRP